MKKLNIKSKNFQYIEKSFKEWLDILGYSRSVANNVPIKIRELFYYLENYEGVEYITSLEIKHIQNHYSNLRHRPNQNKIGALASGTLRKHQNALYLFTDYLRQTGKLTLPYLKLPKENNHYQKRQILTKEEIQALYKSTELYDNKMMAEAIAYRDKVILSIFYACGLRRNEGYHLEIRDINFNKNLLHVRKGKRYKERFVPFSTETANIFKNYIYEYRSLFLNSKHQNYLFISKLGYQMDAQNFNLRLRKMIEKTDLESLKEKQISLHSLRHSIATHLLQNGMSLEKIAQFLGHSSLDSTQIYTHLIKQEHEQL